MERLREETLCSTSTSHDKLVFVGQLIYTHDGNDILQLVVVLQQLFHSLSGIIMVFSDNQRVENTGGRLQRSTAG